VDWGAISRALRGASIVEPAVAVRATREAVKAEKARDLVRLAGDVGRVQMRAGTQAALDGLRLAEGPRDMSRFARLAAAMGRPELASDDRYATHRARGVRQEELDALIGEWTAKLTIEELEAKMVEAGVPAGRVFDAEDMIADLHFAAREALVTVPDEEFGEIRMQGVFPKLSATPGSVRRAAPLTVGQDTADVLERWLGREA
jgi:crotonobetainyl-CoA:carnitine CoA-transferase CaiB-like acyl-CoA transferase